MAPSPTTQDHYQILGLDFASTFDDIKKAYRRLSRLVHPDRYTTPVEVKAATEVFQKLSHAYETLSDGEKRKKYDRNVYSRLTPVERRDQEGDAEEMLNVRLRKTPSSSNPGTGSPSWKPRSRKGNPEPARNEAAIDEQVEEREKVYRQCLQHAVEAGNFELEGLFNMLREGFESELKAEEVTDEDFVRWAKARASHARETGQCIQNEQYWNTCEMDTWVSRGIDGSLFKAEREKAAALAASAMESIVCAARTEDLAISNARSNGARKHEMRLAEERIRLRWNLLAERDKQSMYQYIELAQRVEIKLQQLEEDDRSASPDWGRYCCSYPGCFEERCWELEKDELYEDQFLESEKRRKEYIDSRDNCWRAAKLAELRVLPVWLSAIYGGAYPKECDATKFIRDYSEQLTREQAAREFKDMVNTRERLEMTKEATRRRDRHRLICKPKAEADLRKFIEECDAKKAAPVWGSKAT